MPQTTDPPANSATAPRPTLRVPVRARSHSAAGRAIASTTA